MRVGIVGAGALGSVFGALLLDAGVDVTLIRRNKEQVDLIRKEGLHLEGVSGERKVSAPIFAGDEEFGQVDLAILMVKAYDTRGAIPTLEKTLSPKGTVLTLQNGIGNFEIISEAFPGRVLLGTTTIGALALGSGRFRHTGFGDTHLGEPDGSITERAKSVAGLLKKMEAGETHVVDNAMGCVWSKLVLNAAINAPATLLRVRNGDLVSTDSGRNLVHEVVEECLNVVKSKGVVCEATAGNINSMFQDILAARYTEIDFINAAVVREGEDLGIQAPVNKILAQLIKALELTAKARVRDKE
jgi:2-dehydropantoate 2-reductase